MSKSKGNFITLSEAIERYITDILPKKPKYYRNPLLQLRWWQKTIGEYALINVSPTLIAEGKNQLKQTITNRGQPRSEATVNRYLSALSHVFTTAIKEWGWLENNPLTKVSKLKEPRGRTRFLSEEERAKLLKACQKSSHPYLYLVVVLCLSTGARKMEILGLKWKDVDLERKVITLHETKNGERRLLPLAGHALELMHNHSKAKAANSVFVFSTKNKDAPVCIRTAWEKALKQAETKDFRFHDLRHSTASYLAMNGASMAEIAEVLGHKTLGMVKRYAHLSEAHTAKVVESMNKKIFG